NTRVGLAQTPDQLGHEAIEAGRYKTNAEPSPFVPAQTPGALHDFVQTRRQLQRLLQQKSASLGQFQCARTAFYQCDAEFVFELTNLPAKWRLGNVQPGS